MAEMVKLIVSVPRELKERLDAVAQAEDRPVASVVRRMLAAGLRPRNDAMASVRLPPDVEDSIARKARIRTGLPIGGQDAAAGKGVEERVESAEDRPATEDLMAKLQDSIAAAKAGLPRDGVVVGGEGCTHPHRYQLGRRCEAPGCGKVVR